MADNIAIYAPDGETVLGYVRTVERDTDIHNEVVEINVGGETESLWDGVVTAWAVGSDTFDEALAQDPVPIGGWGYAAGDPTAVSADGDLTRVVTDLQGRVWTRELPLALPHAVDFTENQTGEAIWTPASGARFVVTGYHLSFTAASVITVWETATNNLAGRVFKHSGAVNGGAALAVPFISRTADNVLKYTTGAGAAGSLTVFGYEV